MVEGNEQENDVESIITQGKEGIRAMIQEIVPDQADDLWEFFITSVYPTKVEPLVRSLLEDRNAVHTLAESRIDDLHLTIRL